MGKTFKDQRKADMKKKRFMKGMMQDDYPEYMDY